MLVAHTDELQHSGGRYYRLISVDRKRAVVFKPVPLTRSGFH